MAENTEALTAIQEDIQDQAGMVTRQIQSEVQQLQDEEIHFFSESLQKETGHYEEKEISELELLQATKTSQAKLKIKRDLLAQRQAMASELFNHVADELKAFAASEAYADFMEKKLDKHASLIRKPGTCTVREQDAALMREILKRRGYPQAVETVYLEFGGWRFMCPSEGFEIDETLDNALRNQKEWFQNNSGFTL